jgi:hypothetical protein
MLYAGQGVSTASLEFLHAGYLQLLRFVLLASQYRLETPHGQAPFPPMQIFDLALMTAYPA